VEAQGSPQAAQAPKNDVIVRAMRDELARSMEQLRLDTLPKPYFIAYRVTESQRGVGASARLGALVGEGDGRGSRFLQVEVRVGDYAFDNTNYFGAGFMPAQYVGFGGLPVDDDYQELRRQIWLATDRAYKQALEALAQKRAALETRSRTEDLADFSHEPVTNTVDEVPPPPLPSRQTIEALARDLSATFRSASEIYSSTAGVSISWSRTVYVNSEGTSYVRSRPHASVVAQASTQAMDGTGISMSYVAQAGTFAELPSRDSLMKGVRDLATRLTEQRHVPLADTYDGPVLFEGAAAAELFNQLVGARLIGTRQPITSPTFARVVAGGGNDWADLIGALVLPRWMSVVDDPSVATMDGRPVESYRVDEDGVSTHATTLVDHGMLKTLLTGRTPVTGVDHSTGNRFGGGPRPMHVTVNADSALSDADIRRKLIALAAAEGHPYGVIVRQLSGLGTAGEDPQEMVAIMMGQQDRAAPVVRGMRAVKVFADGHEEPMRGALISGLNATGFKGIVAASQSRTLHADTFFSGASPFAGNAGSGSVNYLMPSLLFTNLSIRKPRGTTPTLPVVAPPPP
jgi:hypothetical protein